MSKKSLLAWKLYRFRTLGEKIPVFGEKKSVSSELKSTRPEVHYEVNTKICGVKLCWLILYIRWTLGRVVRTAFNVSRQIFLAEEIYLKK